MVSTDFSEDEHTVGETPAGWSALWGDEDAFEIADEPRRVVHANTTQDFELLTLDAAGEVNYETDAEVAGLLRVPAESNPQGYNSRFQLHLQASGEPGEYAFYTDATGASVRLNRYREGNWIQRGTSADYAIQPDIWYQVVTHRQEDVWRTKVWPYGEAEPDEWMVETDVTDNDGDLPPGLPGIGQVASDSVNEWAWFSAATGDAQGLAHPDHCVGPQIVRRDHCGDRDVVLPGQVPHRVAGAHRVATRGRTGSGRRTGAA